MPKLDFAFLADAAEAQPGQKFYVLGGGVDSIGAPRFPVAHPHMTLVLRILLHPTEVDRDHRLEVSLIDQDGRELVRADGTVNAKGRTQPGREIGLPIAMNLNNVRFENPGDYSVEILLDDNHVKSLPLRLHEVSGPPPGHPG